MAARFLLDTNICIYVAKRRPPAVLAKFERLKPGDAVLSVITWGELLYGAAKSQQRELALEKLRDLATLTPVSPMPESAAEAYGTIRAALEAKGKPIGGNDLWIAAHAMAAGLSVVTNNAREFRRVKGLRVEEWRG